MTTKKTNQNVKTCPYEAKQIRMDGFTPFDV
jgi:hypothetical protein